MLKLVFVSDTHNNNIKNLPTGDILFHSGDFSGRGDQDELDQFCSYIKQWKKKIPNIVVCAGNHDWQSFYNPGLTREKLAEAGAIYLQDEEVTIEGLRIYGSPWQKEFCNWAFNLPEGPELKAKWDMIPSGIDVLITHSPPFGILDSSPRCGSVGCPDLRDAVLDRIKPRIHSYGHIHHSYGVMDGAFTKFINASLLNEAYRQVNRPIEVELDVKMATD